MNPPFEYNLSQFFRQDTINVFTDASLVNVNGKNYASAGYINIRYMGNDSFIIEEQKEIFLGKVNNINEAEERALNMALKIKEDTNIKVNIFSDSLNCINRLKDKTDVYHVKSHSKNYSTIQEDFEKCNNIRIDKADARLLGKFNGYIDTSVYQFNGDKVK